MSNFLLQNRNRRKSHLLVFPSLSYNVRFPLTAKIKVKSFILVKRFLVVWCLLVYSGFISVCWQRLTSTVSLPIICSWHHTVTHTHTPTETHTHTHTQTHTRTHTVTPIVASHTHTEKHSHTHTQSYLQWHHTHIHTHTQPYPYSYTNNHTHMNIFTCYLQITLFVS